MWPWWRCVTVFTRILMFTHYPLLNDSYPPALTWSSLSSGHTRRLSLPPRATWPRARRPTRVPGPGDTWPVSVWEVTWCDGSPTRTLSCVLSCPSDLETLSCRRLVEPCRGPSLLDLLCSVSVLFAFQEACIDIWYDNDIFSNNYVFVPGLVRLTGKLRSRYLNVCMNIG